MKKILFAATMLLGGIIISQSTNAQVRVGVNINIGDQPPWRAPGYDYVEYYYLPDIECYYDVPRRQFVYLDGSNWMYSSSLPYWCSDYNLYSGYKVVVNRPYAYRYHNDYRVRYPRRTTYYQNNYYRRDNNNYYRRDDNYYRRDNNQWDNNRRDDNYYRRDNNQWDNNRRDNNRWDDNRNDRRNNDRWDNNRRDNDQRDNGRHRGWRRG